MQVKDSTRALLPKWMCENGTRHCNLRDVVLVRNNESRGRGVGWGGGDTSVAGIAVCLLRFGVTVLDEGERQ